MASDDVGAFLSADQAVLALGVKVAGLRLIKINNDNPSPALEQTLQAMEKKLLEGLSNGSIKRDPKISGFRKVHAKISDHARSLMSAPESLLRLLLRSGKLPRINPLVDLYNGVSAESRLALGAHDAGTVSGRIHLGFTTGYETFTPIGSESPVPVPNGEYAYIDESKSILCRLEVRQAASTVVTSDTTESLIILQGTDAHADSDLAAAAERLTGLAETYLGAECEFLGIVRG